MGNVEFLEGEIELLLGADPDLTLEPDRTAGEERFAPGSLLWGGRFLTPSGYECSGCRRRRWPKAAVAATCRISTCR